MSDAVGTCIVVDQNQYTLNRDGYIVNTREFSRRTGETMRMSMKAIAAMRHVC